MKKPTLTKLLSSVYHEEVFILGDSSHGTHIHGFKNQSAGWRWESSPLWRILLYSEGIPPHTNVLVPNDFGQSTLTQDLDSFTIVWSKSGLGTVTVTGELDGDTGERLSLSISVSLSTLIIDSVEFPILKSADTSPEVYAVMTQAGGNVFRNAAQQLNAGLFPNGYMSSTQAVRREEYLSTSVNGLPASMRYSGLYHRTENRAVMLRSTDTTGRRIDFTWGGLGKIWHTHYPEDNGNVSQYTLPYRCEIVPLAGGWYEMARTYRRLCDEDNSPASVLVNPVTVAHRNYKVQFEISLKQIEISVMSESITRFTNEIERALERFGAPILAMIGGWREDVANFNSPDYTVFQEVQDFFSYLDSIGVDVMPYTFFTDWGQDTDWFKTGYLPEYNPPEDLLLLRRDQTPVFHDPPHDQGNVPDLAEEGARANLVDLLANFKNAYPTNALYIDAFGGSSYATFRNTLPSSRLGHGSNSYAQGQLTFLDDLRDVYTNELFTTEFPDDLLIGRISGFSCWIMNLLSPSSTLTHLQMFISAWSDKAIQSLIVTTLQGFNPGIDPILGALYTKLYRWLAMMHWGNGAPFTLSQSLISVVPYFVEEGEDDYDDWLAYTNPILESMEDITQYHDVVKEYLKGTRLKPPPNSWDAYTEEVGFTQIYVDFTTNLKFLGNDIIYVLWVKSNGDILIQLGNFREEAVKVDVDISKDVYPTIVGKTRVFINTIFEENINGYFHKIIEVAPGRSVICEIK